MHVIHKDNNERIIFMPLDFKKYLLFTYIEDVEGKRKENKIKEIIFNKNSFKYKCIFML